jgi:hypothetical protein
MTMPRNMTELYLRLPTHTLYTTEPAVVSPTGPALLQARQARRDARLSGRWCDCGPVYGVLCRSLHARKHHTAFRPLRFSLRPDIPITIRGLGIAPRFLEPGMLVRCAVYHQIVCECRAQTGRVGLNFGPLNQAGGECRLSLGPPIAVGWNGASRFNER